MQNLECGCDATHYARGRCRRCYEKYLRSSNPNFAERQRQNRRAWELKNKERIKAHARKRAADPYCRQRDAATKRRALLARYGLTQQRYDAMLTAQRGVCAICMRPERTKLHIDHDHKTGRVRGLLCFDCNHRIVGNVERDINLFGSAMAYLTRTGTWRG